MSRHNNYNNYRQMNNNRDRSPVAKVEENHEVLEVNNEETVEVATVDVVEEPAVEVVEELPVIEGDGNAPLVGTTTTKLNIRSTPEVADNIVTVVNEGTVVMIDYPVADGDWFKIYTEAGVEGYCMKKFVKVSE